MQQRVPHSFLIAAIASSAIEPLLSVVDTAVAGHIATQTIACLALGGGLAAALVWIGFQALGGLPGVVGRLRGGGHSAEARLLAGEAAWAALLGGALLAGPAALLADVGLGAAVAHEPTASGAAHYLAVRMLGMPFSLCLFVLIGVLRTGHKDGWGPVVIMVVVLGANVGLDLFLAIGLGWDLSGLALASAISPALGCAVGVFLLRRRGGIDLTAGLASLRARLGGAALRLSLRLGGPLVLRALMLNAVLFTAAAWSERFGTEALAAHGLALQVWLLLAFSIDGFALAGQAFASHMLGAGDGVGARRLARHLLVFCLLAVSVLAFALSAIWSTLPTWFSLDGAAAAAFESLRLPMLVQMPLAVGAFVTDGLLKGAGDVRFLAIQLALSSLLVFPVVLMLFGVNLPGLWWAIDVWLLTRAILGLSRIFGDRWIIVATEQMSEAVEKNVEGS
jgi:putative MATE family efflux protein